MLFALAEAVKEWMMKPGLKNCVEGLQKILPLAEKSGITIQMELLNSKVDHKDYMCDKTPWELNCANALDRKNQNCSMIFIILQIDEGDVIRTIRDNHQYIDIIILGEFREDMRLDESQNYIIPQS